MKRLLWLLCVLPAMANAQCLGEQAAAEMAARWIDKQTLRGFSPAMTLADAACTRDRFVAQLRANQQYGGRVAGYKAALTNPEVQKRFGASAPVRGVLLSRMLTMESGFPVFGGYAARPVFEADLLVEVGDDAINDARTPLEALKALSRVHPFVELADLVVADGETLNASVITAINAGARSGIFGQGIPVQPTQAFADALRDMRVVMTDDVGNELANTPGSAIMGHPLNAVLWLIEDVRKSGGRLRVGDKLSLGSFSAPLIPQREMRLKVRYIGLPGDPQINMRFR
ncbi:MAG: fumarylacetoacetate hydrolase [Burkholderiales bacterium]